ncbi:hypothetical protein DMB65_03645 [Flavobacterium cheongpyeongense]|jgi:hypothetical protein|uniref:Uncharacterized protein n=1 Tax=Flavobacterium cheongpyeongense TaxID=2212651 RepID=A0A2V4C800_9FLAO|nr:hypothetical protein [Flavobacterium cheongpyeongense]PXY42334.1 hypothetical protein DMB65_03645 [Flavobacterium cheongpyeongense]
MNINTIDTLNQQIKLLEELQHKEWCDIKEEIGDVKENLKPTNLIRKAVGEINDSIGIRSEIAQSAISILIGYLAKKIVVGKTHSTFKNILGSVLQLAVTTLVSKPHENSSPEKEESSLKHEPS